MATFNYTANDIQRFWNKVNKEGSIPPHCPELGACWEWTARRLPKGYGMIGIMQGGKQKQIGAHRVSWQIHNGDIPNKLFVLHKCDNPSCVNPAHLFLGTAKDNSDDMDKKGRRTILTGELAASSKLTQSQVDYIRQRYAQGGITQAELAKEIGCNSSNICHIVTGRRWNNIS